MFICGNFTEKQKKPCKFCRSFYLWGVGSGYCAVQGEGMMSWDHCTVSITREILEYGLKMENAK